MSRDGRGPWWRDAVVYQVYVRSFADGNGDGVGDLAGLRERLPYLAELGVDALWINPWYVSPMADGGYDVADYRDIDPVFGTLAEAEALIAEAHALGLRVILDIVPNHTSDQHEWFTEALAAGAGSPARDRYVIRYGHDGQPPNQWRATFGGSAWEPVLRPAAEPGQRDTTASERPYYLHLFAPEQPDLNWRNQEVIAEFESILEFWLDRGVDGFRVDVANCIIKPEQLVEEPGSGGDASRDATTGAVSSNLVLLDQPGVHEIYRGWRRVLDRYEGERMAIGEIWVPDVDRLALYLRPDELHQAFNFRFLTAPWDPAAMREVIDASLAANAGVGAPTTWVLSNHDVVRHPSRYGGGDLGLRRARAATVMVLALPGGAYVYQGEELGLPQVDDLPEEVLQDPVWVRSGHTERGRDGCRVPLPWTTTGPSYGFSTAPGWLPQPRDWGARSVAAQSAADGSTLELYREALRLRRAADELGDGPMRWRESPPEVLLFDRGPGEGSAGSLVCALNLGQDSYPPPPGGELLLASGPLDPDGALPPDTAAWWRTA